MKEIPEHYAPIEDNFCSNFDGVIDYEVAERLKKEDICAGYPAWEWHGDVWYDKTDNVYCCLIMRYHSHIDTVEAETPEELRTKCCELYGGE